MNNFFATLVTLTAALAWLRLMDFAAQRGWLESRLSRKIIHIGTGPIYVLCWLLFLPTPDARFWAALVPLAITLQFALIGFGLIKDEASVQAMSRSGDPREILRGPLYYGLAFVALTLIFWKDSPVGMVALMSMCGGDGIADIVGRRIQSPRWPWSREKSVAGSLAVFLGAFWLSLVILAVYVALNVFPAPLTRFLLPLAALSLLAAAVESLPHKDVDNLTVTLAVAVAGWFLL
ncbi:MAG: phosphatidate cytidylyltransferase [Anaerolineae bacterium CG_4_9_14_3_um_filter_57_17]|nr:phosphatidate cytidylyltransferase [bacterium]NCT20849.1 phosphatidate cytidylyltransferase [bacterium]OIO84437.1 MAG: phosphatidate cytidylyltransferase [Anaerolineae bacterium CG2_30_57_67]PJB65221.1 MAG: phosphatidate cytidylyltransferase [Anaerolineae bacterium CG_4_9_14_3_um_filter_57_17]